MENSKSQFKVVIIGGSITGLTLAHCLVRANIDHIVLEKRADIAPQEGAFIGIWPNGARVLQQLGVYDALEKLTTPVNRMNIAFPDGFSFSSELPKNIHERLEYPIISLERRKVLKILYEAYPCKQKILLNKKVTEVRLLRCGAGVVTEDGTVFQGDLIVGADGVHSRVRSEMWRLAELESPGSIEPSEKTGLTVEYACVFGISTPIPGLHRGEHVNRYGNGFSVITFHGRSGEVFWCIIQKLERQYVYPNVPRFTPKDAAGLCHKLEQESIWRGIRVGDLWKNREVVSMTALEEGCLPTWYFNRIVLLGDSIHKMTPNIGQGANTSIEEVAVLASLLNRLVHQNPAVTPTMASLGTLLHTFQGLRHDRSHRTYQRSRFGARFHSRDDWVKATMGRYVFPYVQKLVARRTYNMLATGDVLDFLPAPERGMKYSSGGPETMLSRWALLSVVCLVLYLFSPVLRTGLMLPFPGFKGLEGGPQE